MKVLRQYQVRVCSAQRKFMGLKTRNRAQVYAPTGAGKTVCFTNLVNYAIDECGARNILILHPTLALSKDQLIRFKGDITADIHYTSFHSGTHYKGVGEVVAEKSTTDAVELQRIIAQAKTVLGKPHVTFSSYDSHHKLVDIEFDLIIADEAHNMVKDKFSKNLSLMKAKKMLFYTATPMREEAEDSGMKDISLFGRVIAQVTPRELIERGYIVAPLVNTLEITTNKRADQVDIIDTIVPAFIHQHQTVAAWGNSVHQMLVACRDVQGDINQTINQQLQRIRSEITTKSGGSIDGDTVDVYTVSAQFAYKNGSPVAGGGDARANALLDIKNSKRNVILAHYDTLSEGIDVPTLGGVVIMREMTKSKVIQTIGRTARPNELDMFNGEPVTGLFDCAKDIDTRKKRRSLITFPIVDGEWVSGTQIKTVAEAFIAGNYGDLLDCMVKPPHKPTGKKQKGEGDDPFFYSAARAYAVLQEMKALREIFSEFIPSDDVIDMMEDEDVEEVA